MHDVMRKRLLRKLESLPEDKLYQVLDYIEFLESKYAVTPSKPSVVQSIGERLEDGLRALSVGPKAVTGTMRMVGFAGKVLDGIGDAGREIVKGLEDATTAATRPRPATPPARTGDLGVPAGSEAVPRAGDAAREPSTETGVTPAVTPAVTAGDVDPPARPDIPAPAPVQELRPAVTEPRLTTDDDTSTSREA